ncbi:hypothetical protein L596_011576 [Steinernema carpocapsae]|uniref:Uncharacterized protein n=1 Tax=Steinernema carpocapsae TaxID=34508 RepID=A0A4U5NV44_STECR|nr:hypothetical protein L596_011576 [Steinernema carpocapsae]
MSAYLWTRVLCLFVMIVGVLFMITVPWVILRSLTSELESLKKSNVLLESKGTNACKGIPKAQCQRPREQEGAVQSVFECSSDKMDAKCECPYEKSCAIIGPKDVRYSCSKDMLEVAEFDSKDGVFLSDQAFPAARSATKCA